MFCWTLKERSVSRTRPTRPTISPAIRCGACSSGFHASGSCSRGFRMRWARCSPSAKKTTLPRPSAVRMRRRSSRSQKRRVDARRRASTCLRTSPTTRASRSSAQNPTAPASRRSMRSMAVALCRATTSRDREAMCGPRTQRWKSCAANRGPASASQVVGETEARLEIVLIGWKALRLLRAEYRACKV